MSHEIFINERRSKLEPADEHRAEYMLEKLIAAEDVGLRSEATHIKREIISIERGSLIKTAPLTQDEITIWNAWLPTRYFDTKYGMKDSWALDYSFDRVPAPVIKKWQAHKAAGDFESYEIWTPERTPVFVDPILVGINGSTLHLIARWGESDANLVTLDDIKAKLVRRWNNGWLPSSLYVGVGAFLFVVIAAAWIGVDIASLPTVIMIAAGAGVLGILGTQLYKMFWVFGKNPLMQAIRRHKAVDREMEPASA